MRSKKAQMQVAFNWIYILIAGGIILLFFMGIVFKQKSISEEQLRGDIIEVIESIFTAASVSENTKNTIPTHGLSKETLAFDCFERVGKYGLKDTSASIEDSTTPIFSPSEIQSTHLIAWSLPYHLPFKVSDFLFISSSNTKYYVLGGQRDAFKFMNATDGFNTKWIQGLDEVTPEKNFQVRIVDLEGRFVPVQPIAQRVLEEISYKKITAVTYRGDQDTVTYYTLTQDGQWREQGGSSIVSVAKFDAAFFGSVFAQTAEQYECNMQKAFTRLKYISEIYEQKAIEIEDFYIFRSDLPQAGLCKSAINGNTPDVLGSIESLKNEAQSCISGLGSCSGFITPAENLANINKQLDTANCISLY